MADQRTLVLDEVGELPLAIQAKLLRALQDGEIQPVGAGKTEKVNVRIVASTNRDLAAAIRAGRFREDLYYRLAVVESAVPPLRDRREDIPALVREFARRYGEQFGMGEIHLAPALLDQLFAFDWPGNVRQLENTITRIAAVAAGNEIGPEVLAGVEPAEGAARRDDDLVGEASPAPTRPDAPGADRGPRAQRHRPDHDERAGQPVGGGASPRHQP